MYADVGGLEPLPIYPLFIEFNYLLLRNDPHFKKIRNNIPLIATWDDHDYGQNNGGKLFPHKEASNESFMDFYSIPENSSMRGRDGIYESYYFNDGGERLQVILLDTRWNLDVIGPEPLTPTSNTELDMLGEAQWAWLEAELRQPATVRIIGSSTQFCIEPNTYEAWANYPHEQDRMFDLIASTRAEGVFFISGDVHYSEASRQQREGLYPIYDFTSSGITNVEGSPKPNSFRIGEAFNDNNFGMITIDWISDPVTIRYDILDKNAQVARSFLVDLDELRF